jgi:hypothetical protein
MLFYLTVLQASLQVQATSLQFQASQEVSSTLQPVTIILAPEQEVLSTLQPVNIILATEQEVPSTLQPVNIILAPDHEVPSTLQPVTFIHSSITSQTFTHPPPYPVVLQDPLALRWRSTLILDGAVRLVRESHRPGLEPVHVEKKRPCKHPWITATGEKTDISHIYLRLSLPQIFWDFYLP